MSAGALLRRCGLVIALLWLLTANWWPAVAAAPPGPARGPALATDEADAEIVVLFRAGGGASRARTAADSGVALATSPTWPELALLRVDPARRDATLAQLRADPAVALATPNGRFRLTELPSDYRPDWQPNLAPIDWPAAWQAGLTGQSVTVAVIDSGIDPDHPDLAAAVDRTRSRSFVRAGLSRVSDAR